MATMARAVDIQQFTLRLLAAAICALYFSSGMLKAADRVIVVGVYENEPKVFTGKDGQPAGFFIDIVKYMAEREGWTLQYSHGTWDECLSRLSHGEIDIMPDVAYTVDRAARFSFHQVPVLSSWSQVYSREGSGMQSIIDLDGKRIAVLRASVQQEVFERMADSFGLKITLVPMADYNAIFRAVAEGKADAAIANNFYGLAHAKAFGLADTAVVFSPAKLLFATAMGDPKKLLEAIDRHLAGLKGNSQSAYYAALKKWTAEEVKFNLPLWLKMAGITLGLALAISVLCGIILKRQVNAQTSQLRELNVGLEQRVVERTAELAAAMQKAQEADRIKSAFLATMSHELRTPLNSIIGFTGIMLQDLAGPLNVEQRKQMGMVQGSARHLLSLINDVLDISKIEAGQLKLANDKFSLRESLEKVGKLLQPLAEKKGIAIKLDIEEGMGLIRADQRRLEQIILNLGSNSIKFTESGEVSISCRKVGGDCLISVADTGIGMSASEIPGLFQPFHQVDSGLSRKHDGTGLGLSICKKILDLMGGSIKVESMVGRGSTFTVRFPIQGADNE